VFFPDSNLSTIVVQQKNYFNPKEGLDFPRFLRAEKGNKLLYRRIAELISEDLQT
jgi:hypothetical protein